MSRYKIITFPSPLLKKVCKQVNFPLNQITQQNIQALKYTFRQSFMQKGVKTLGLAAPQIGVLQRFFIMPKTMNFKGISIKVLKSVVRNFNVYINPKIICHSDNKVRIMQNCLSVGDDLYDVERSQKITVQYFDLNGYKIEENLSGIKARVFLHQNDHLDGITMQQRGTLYNSNAQISKDQLKSEIDAKIEQKG